MPFVVLVPGMVDTRLLYFYCTVIVPTAGSQKKNKRYGKKKSYHLEAPKVLQYFYRQKSVR
ncbi:MAG: hypothetical protein RH948_08550 [Cyclobacteriaceae bacterium]